VIRLRFSIEDLTRIHFAFCPVRETVLSVRALSTGSSNGLHGPWLRRVRPRLEGVDLELLTAVVRPTGYIPDFLLPPLTRRQSTFGSGLSQVAATSTPDVASQLVRLAGHRIAQSGPGKARRVELLHELVDAPPAGLARIVTELERYWQVAVAPYWPRIQALLQADLAHRLQQLASGGVRQLFRTLHPLVSFHGDTLQITKYYTGHADLRQRGLLLVPCVFAWPDVIVRTADPEASVTYSPRGLGRLWDAASPHHSPLAGVLGRTRAAILAQLDLPMSTTQLSRQLNLAAPTLNVHLKALHAAGIVSTQRDGRAVLYHRTKLGDQLLAGTTPPARDAMIW
jgi:DNA-binding transcriptional ArsR family regulator